MVLPLIPIAGAAIAGGIGGGILGSLFGGSKKEELVQEQTGKIDVVVEAAPYQHYAPQKVYQPTYTQSYVGATTVIESPGAITTKKVVTDISPRIDQKGQWDMPVDIAPTQELGQEAGIGEGVNLTHIAIVAAVALIGYGFMTGDKRK